MVTTMQSVLQPIQFPLDKEIELKVKIRISTQEDYDYFLDSKGDLQAGFLADIYDMLDMIDKHIITINGLTYQEIQRIVRE